MSLDVARKWIGLLLASFAAALSCSEKEPRSELSGSADGGSGGGGGEISQAIRATRLRAEYRVNPLGIDAAKPRLDWLLESDVPAQKQTAYQIVAVSTREALLSGQGDLWDTGKVPSDQTTQIAYDGKALGSRARAWWTVRVWDKDDDPSAWSEPAWWETGLLQPSDWQARWIASPSTMGLGLDGAGWIWFPEGDPGSSAPAGERFFRRAFTLPAGRAVVTAICDITTDNEFELFVNGTSVGSETDWKEVRHFSIGSLVEQRRERDRGPRQERGWSARIRLCPGAPLPGRRGRHRAVDDLPGVRRHPDPGRAVHVDGGLDRLHSPREPEFSLATSARLGLWRLALDQRRHGQEAHRDGLLRPQHRHHGARGARARDDADAAQYAALFESIKSAFNSAYVQSDGKIRGDTQTSYALALRFNLLPDALRPLAVQRLADNVTARGHLCSGFIGVAHLLPALSAGGRSDIAYQLLNTETFPSWFYEIKKGATTIWERWDGIRENGAFQDPGMNSFNHYSFGAVGEWMYSTIAGIALDETHPGYKHFFIRPEPGGGLDAARGSLDTIHGTIVSDWKVANEVFTLKLTVPVNTTASVRLPYNKEVRENGAPVTAGPDGDYPVPSGHYEFTASTQ